MVNDLSNRKRHSGSSDLVDRRQGHEICHRYDEALHFRDRDQGVRARRTSLWRPPTARRSCWRGFHENIVERSICIHDCPQRYARAQVCSGVAEKSCGKIGFVE
jgi:hypothetical protein